MGLVNHAVRTEEFEAFVGQYTSEMANRCSPRSLQIIKKQIRLAGHDSLLESVALAGRELRGARESLDYAEGKAAFREKRRPKFTGA